MVTTYKQYIFQNMFTTQIWPSHCPSSRMYWHHDRYCWRNKHVPHQFQCNAEHSTWIKHYQTGLQTCDIVLTIWYWSISVATKFLFSTARWPPCSTVVTPPWPGWMWPASVLLLTVTSRSHDPATLPAAVYTTLARPPASITQQTSCITHDISTLHDINKAEGIQIAGVVWVCSNQITLQQYSTWYCSYCMMGTSKSKWRFEITITGIIWQTVHPQQEQGHGILGNKSTKA